MNIVDVPFAYALTAVPSGSVVPRLLAVSDVAPVGIEEVGPSDAPVAARLDVAGGARRVWREVGGRLMEERRDAHALVPHGSPLNGGERLPMASEVNLRRVDVSDHGAARVAAVAHAETCLAFGNGFLVPSPGPCLALIGDAQGYVGLQPKIVVMDPRDASAPFIVTSAGTLDRFWAWAESSPALKAAPIGRLKASVRVDGKGARPPEVKFDFSISRPDALRFDVEGLCLVAAARHVFDTGLTNRMVAAYPSEFLEGWLAYRNGSVDTAVADERLADILRSAGRSASSLRVMDDTDARLATLLGIARSASERWDLSRDAEPSTDPRP